jgi:hypothetical protein
MGIGNRYGVSGFAMDEKHRLKSPPLVERVRELPNAESSEQENEEMPTGEKLVALFKEMQADYAAAKREDAHNADPRIMPRWVPGGC